MSEEKKDVELHHVKINLSNNFATNTVSVDGKELWTAGTKVVTRLHSVPEVMIYVVAETVDQEVVGTVEYKEVEQEIRIWAYEHAPDEYKKLSSFPWAAEDTSILRYPMFGDRAPNLPESFQEILWGEDSNTVTEHDWGWDTENGGRKAVRIKTTKRRERYELDSGYAVIIWGGNAESTPIESWAKEESAE